MKGLLAHRSPINQLIILVGIALFSFIFIFLLGTAVLQALTGISASTLETPTAGNLSKAEVRSILRWLQLFQFIGFFVVPSWICSRLFSHEPNRFLGLQAPNLRQFWFWSILIMLISYPFVQFIGELNKQIVFSGELKEWMDASEKSAERITNALLSGNTPLDLLLNIIFVAVFAGVGEELLFRGMIQRLLSRKFGQWTGIIVTAVLFSAIHLQFYGFFPRFLLGVVLGILFAYSGSLWVAILAHFFYDAMLITAVYLHPELMNTELDIPMIQLILPALISLLLSVWVIRQMIERSREFPPDEPPYKVEDPNNPFSS